jgi:hypothetical protein
LAAPLLQAQCDLIWRREQAVERADLNVKAVKPYESAPQHTDTSGRGAVAALCEHPTGDVSHGLRLVVAVRIDAGEIEQVHRLRLHLGLNEGQLGGIGAPCVTNTARCELAPPFWLGMPLYAGVVLLAVSTASRFFR